MTLAELYAYYGMTPPGPQDYDPRVMDPATETDYWRNEAERARHSSFDSLAAGGINALGALGGFALSSPGGQRTRTALGRYVFGSPDSRVRSLLGNALGWGNTYFAGDQGYRAYQQAERRREALRMLDLWERGQGMPLREMTEGAFAPRVPGSK